MQISKTIRDDIHGDIVINSKVIMELINTFEFQRLRRIIQLGGGQFVFPSANHTRFSHSIGVYNVINKFLQNENISSRINESQKICVQIAGLLHDLGHGPFSHSFEAISVQSHEKYTTDIINGDTEINEVLLKNNINPKEISSIIEGKHENFVLNLLVSSQIDADRLDYLLRDSKNAGVSYSSLDINWIIKNALIYDEKLVFKSKSLHAIESFLLGRYHMYKQVYNHKVSESFDETFKIWFKRLKDLYQQNYTFKFFKVIDIFKELLDGKVMSTKSYIKLDDYSMSYIFKELSEEDDQILSDLSKRILKRNFFELHDSSNKNELMKKVIDQKFNLDYYFIEKDTSVFNVYKSNKSIKDESIYIIEKNNIISELSKISSIINSSEIKKHKIYFLPKEIE